MTVETLAGGLRAMCNWLQNSMSDMASFEEARLTRVLVVLLREVVALVQAAASGRELSDRNEAKISIAVVEEPYDGAFKIEKM